MPLRMRADCAADSARCRRARSSAVASWCAMCVCVCVCVCVCGGCGAPGSSVGGDGCAATTRQHPHCNGTTQRPPHTTRSHTHAQPQPQTTHQRLQEAPLVFLQRLPGVVGGVRALKRLKRPGGGVRVTQRQSVGVGAGWAVRRRGVAGARACQVPAPVRCGRRMRQVCRCGARLNVRLQPGACTSCRVRGARRGARPTHRPLSSSSSSSGSACASSMSRSSPPPAAAPGAPAAAAMWLLAGLLPLALAARRRAPHRCGGAGRLLCVAPGDRVAARPQQRGVLLQRSCAHCCCCEGDVQHPCCHLVRCTA
jgi:hypothetical protein